MVESCRASVMHTITMGTSTVGRLAEQSMQKAVKEVQTLSDYAAKGEVIKLATCE